MARLSAVLAILAASGFATAAPARAEQAVTVQITQLPGEFVAGGSPAAVKVEASRGRGHGRSRCIRVRWSLVLRVDGGSPARVQVERIEQDRSFPVEVERADDAIRFTDRRLDPGRLCRERAVTAQYKIVIPAGATGESGALGGAAELSLAAEAFSAGGDLLDRTTVTRQIRPVETAPSPDPAAGAVPPPSPSPSAAGHGLAGKRTGGTSVTRIGPIGFGVGVVMVLVGVTLLVRVRRRSRGLRQAGLPAAHQPAWTRPAGTQPGGRR